LQLPGRFLLQGLLGGWKKALGCQTWLGACPNEIRSF
jgi:hypothetical protein